MIGRALIHGATGSPTEDFAILCNRPRGPKEDPPQSTELPLLRQLVKWERICLCQCARELETRQQRVKFLQDRLTECEKLTKPTTRLKSSAVLRKREEWKKKLGRMTAEELTELVGKLEARLA